MPNDRTCIVCGERKPIDAFYEEGDSYASKCKPCYREYNRARTHGNMPAFRAKYGLDSENIKDIPKRESETYWEYAKRLRDRCAIKTYEMVDIAAQGPMSQQEARERVMGWWLPPGPDCKAQGDGLRSGRAGYKDRQPGHVGAGDEGKRHEDHHGIAA